MPTYHIDALSLHGSGRVVEPNRLEFGGLTVEYNPGRNRFYLSDPHSDYRSVILYESDFTQFIAFILERFIPYNESIKRGNPLSEPFDRVCKATYLVEALLADVRNWTSKHCIDCVAQRDRVDQARRVMDLIFSGVSGETLIDVRTLNSNEAQLRGESQRLADAIQEHVAKRRMEHRKKGIN